MRLMRVTETPGVWTPRATRGWLTPAAAATQAVQTRVNATLVWLTPTPAAATQAVQTRVNATLVWLTPVAVTRGLRTCPMPLFEILAPRSMAGSAVPIGVSDGSRARMTAESSRANRSRWPGSVQSRAPRCREILRHSRSR